MKRIEQDLTRWKGLCAVAIAVAILAGCGASSVSVATKVADKVEKPGANGVAQLDLAKVQDRAGTSRFVRIRQTMVLHSGSEAIPATQMTMTTDRKTKRSEIHTDGNDAAGTAGLTERTIGATMYAKADGQAKWVKLAIDPALTKATTKIGKPSSLLDTLGKLGTNLHRDGVADYDGEKLARYTGDLDWGKYLETMKSANELSNQFFSQMPPGAHVDGTVTALIDPSGAPRHLQMTISVSKDGESFRIVSSATYLSTRGLTGIDEPAPSEVARTVPVHSSADLQKEITQLVGGSGATS